MANISIPVPILDWDSPNTAESFKIFQQRLELYFTAKGTKEEEKVPIILLATGEEGIRRYNSWSMSNEDRRDANKIFNAFLEQLEPATNHRICRLELSRYQQKPTETTDIFLNRCRLQAKKCDFTAHEMNERLVEILIANTPIPDLQKELLNKPKGYTIEEAVKLARTYEASAVYINKIHQLHGLSQIDTINRGGRERQEGNRNTSNLCKNCGRDHRFGKEHCPAKNDICSSCEKMGHWAKLCFSARLRPRKQEKPWHKTRSQPRHRQHGTGRKVDSVAEHDDRATTKLHAAMEHLTFSTINSEHPLHKQKTTQNEAFVNINVILTDHPGTHSLKLKVDTGAQANTLPLRIFRSMCPSAINEDGNPIPGSLNPTKCVLTAYNNTEIKCHGTTNIRCKYKDFS